MQEHETEERSLLPLPPPPQDALSPSAFSSHHLSASEGEGDEADEHELEDLACVKPAIQYHASQFLVVKLPNGLYAVAVAEKEEGEEEGVEGEEKTAAAVGSLEGGVI